MPLSTMQKAQECCKLIYGFCRLPVRISDERSELVVSLPDLPVLWNIRLRPQIAAGLHQLAAKGPILESFNSILLYACISFLDGEERFFLSLGPALLSSPTRYDIERALPIFSVLDDRPMDVLSKLVRILPVFDMSRFASLLQMAHLALTGETIGLSEMFLTGQTLFPEEELEQKLEERVFTDRERGAGALAVPYEFERQIAECVRCGNLRELEQLLKAPPVEPDALSGEDPLRKAKNLFIVVAAVAARTVIGGGMEPEAALRLGDVYMQRAETLSEIRDVDALCVKMLADFTERCAHGRFKNEVSEPVRRCQEYISGHLHFDITLAVLAQQAGLTPHYLSRLFKKETGITVTAYIQRERVQEAKNLLRFTDYTYLEISNFLNFVSQSYFIQIFKRYAGMTPQEYRVRYMVKSLSENKKAAGPARQ